jgi:uracil-DNA glycosylase
MLTLTTKPETLTLMSVQIEETWRQALSGEFEQPCFHGITAFLKKEIAAKKAIYPPGPLIFNAFNTTPFGKVKVVILGQDPYIKPGEAMGLSFSVPKGVRIPPSLKNIYKELANDLGCRVPTHGDLTKWAQQGVFLLNAALTVERGTSNSHASCGWHTFTDAVIRTLSERREGLVFMLWGNFAKKKAGLIDPFRHLILEAAHPSPLAGGAFSGSGHFSKANEYFSMQGQETIDWQID